MSAFNNKTLFTGLNLYLNFQATQINSMAHVI